MISNALDDKPLPIYGDGMQVRDWLFVEDHCRALLAVLEKGREGEVYNIGGSLALPNLDVVRRILKSTGKPESLMTRVTDRPGHDRRYALSSEKLERETGWKPLVPFDEGLELTVRWYRENTDWVERVKSGEYQRYYEKNYAGRRLHRARGAANPGRRPAFSRRASESSPCVRHLSRAVGFVENLHHVHYSLPFAVHATPARSWMMQPVLAVAMTSAFTRFTESILRSRICIDISVFTTL
jgi:hypothetical protein